MKAFLATLTLGAVFAAVAFSGGGASAEAPAAAAPARPDAAGPRIAIDPASFDFGRAGAQKALTKEFTVRNYGTQELVIEKISTSCGCTAAFLEGDVKSVKPGGSAVLRVTFHTQATTVESRVTKSVLVRSNDPTTPVLEAKIHATVLPDPAATLK